MDCPQPNTSCRSPCTLESVSTPETAPTLPETLAAKHRKKLRHRIAIAAIALAVFDSWLGSSAFMGAGESMAISLDTTHLDVVLALGAYPVALILVCVAGGRLADILGRKKVFIWAGVGFAIVGLFAPLIDTTAGLVALRALMGVAAGLILPATGGILVTTMHGATRHNAWLWWRAAGMAGLVLGPVVGPLIAHTLTWRWIEPISSLVMIAAVILGAMSMKNSHDKGSRFSAAMIAPTLLLGLGLLAPYLLVILAKESIGGIVIWGVVTILGIVSVAGFIFLNRRLVSPIFSEDIAGHNARLWLTDSFSAVHVCGIFVTISAYAVVLGVGAGLDSAQTAIAMLLMVVPTIGFHLSAHHLRNTRSITRQMQTGIGCVLMVLAVICYYLLNRGQVSVWSMAATLVLAGSGFGMLRLFGHMGVIKVTGTRYAGTLFGTRTFGNHSGTALGGLLVGLVLASGGSAVLAQDPQLALEAATVANVSIITVVVITSIFIFLKHQVLGFEDVHWHHGVPDIVDTSAAPDPAATASPKPPITP